MGALALSLVQTGTSLVVAGRFSEHGRERFEAASAQSDALQAQQQGGPLDVYPNTYHALVRYRFNPPQHGTVATMLWRDRFPGIDEYDGWGMADIGDIAENPTWHNSPRPVKLGEVTQSFLDTGCTGPFMALPLTAQKIVALQQIAKALTKVFPLGDTTGRITQLQLLAFPELVADTLHSLGVSIHSDLTHGVLVHSADPNMDPQIQILLRNIAENLTYTAERVRPARGGLEYYVVQDGDDKRIAAVVGPYGIPLPVSTELRSNIFSIDHYDVRMVLTSATEGSSLAYFVDDQGRVFPYRRAERMKRFRDKHYFISSSGSATYIPPRDSANAYCVESGRKCWVEKAGEAFHFVVYDSAKHGGDPRLAHVDENTVIWNRQLYLRQTDGRFQLAADGYYAGQKLWKVSGGRVTESGYNAQGTVHNDFSATDFEYFHQAHILFDPQLRRPIAFWHPTQAQWVLLGDKYNTYNPIFNGNTYAVPYDVDGRYYTHAELESASGSATLKSLGPAV